MTPVEQLLPQTPTQWSAYLFLTVFCYFILDGVYQAHMQVIHDEHGRHIHTRHEGQHGYERIPHVLLTLVFAPHILLTLVFVVAPLRICWLALTAFWTWLVSTPNDEQDDDDGTDGTRYGSPEVIWDY